MESYQIRPAQADDIDAIAAAASESWKHTYGSIYPEDVIRQFLGRAYSTDNLIRSINRDSALENRLFHVAVDSNGEVVAFSHVVPVPDKDAVYELVRIYALPSCHGTGVGTALLRHLLQTVPSIRELSAWVERGNTIGKSFYERHGFRVTEEMEDDFFGHKTRLVKYTLTGTISDSVR